MRQFLLDMRKDFLIMSNFYLVEILSEPNSLTIVTSKKILQMSNYVLILSIFFFKMRIRNLQCTSPLLNNVVDIVSFSRQTNTSYGKHKKAQALVNGKTEIFLGQKLS